MEQFLATLVACPPISFSLAVLVFEKIIPLIQPLVLNYPKCVRLGYHWHTSCSLIRIVDLFLNELKADEKVFMYEFLLLAVVVIYVAISYGSGAH